MSTTFKPVYTNAVAMTITLANLSSTTSDPPPGRESTVVDNSSNLYIDALLSGQITTGTSPTASKQIVVAVYGTTYDGTNTYYPAGATGSDANLTPTAAGLVGPPGFLVPAVVIPTNSTTNVKYKFGPVSVAQVLGLQTLPIKWGVFVWHNTGVALENTGGDQFIYYQGVQLQGV